MKTKNLFIVAFLFLGGFANAQTLKATLFKDANGTGSWSMGGTGHNLEFREPEDNNQVWARFDDDFALELIGTPNLLANGYANLNVAKSSGVALKVFGKEALWYNDADGHFSWGFGGSYNEFRDKMVIGSSSNPGSYMLAVHGKVWAKEIVVESSWADFVFEKDYKLRALEEVEHFIKENGHLPEIPSAKEVEENGVSVGEMESKLLMKVEELTLYVIQLKKELEELKGLKN